MNFCVVTLGPLRNRLTRFNQSSESRHGNCGTRRGIKIYRKSLSYQNSTGERTVDDRWGWSSTSSYRVVETSWWPPLAVYNQFTLITYLPYLYWKEMDLYKKRPRSKTISFHPDYILSFYSRKKYIRYCKNFTLTRTEKNILINLTPMSRPIEQISTKFLLSRVCKKVKELSTLQSDEVFSVVNQDRITVSIKSLYLTSYLITHQ